MVVWRLTPPAHTRHGPTSRIPGMSSQSLRRSAIRGQGRQGPLGCLQAPGTKRGATRRGRNRQRGWVRRAVPEMTAVPGQGVDWIPGGWYVLIPRRAFGAPEFPEDRPRRLVQQDPPSAAIHQPGQRCSLAGENQCRPEIRLDDHEEGGGQKGGHRLLCGNAPRLGGRRGGRLRGTRPSSGVQERSTAPRHDGIGTRQETSGGGIATSGGGSGGGIARRQAARQETTASPLNGPRGTRRPSGGGIPPGAAAGNRSPGEVSLPSRAPPLGSGGQ